MNVSEVLLNIAKDDWSASQILFEKKLYSQAVFYLQQSVEKSAKSLIIEMELSNIEDVKRYIGHDTIKIIELLKEKNIIINKEKNKILEAIPKLKDSIFDNAVGANKDLIDLGNKDIEDISTNLKHSSTTIEHTINAILGFFNEFLELEKMISNEGIESLIDEDSVGEIINIAQLITEQYPIEEKYKKFSDPRKIKLFIEVITKNILLFIPCLISLLVLALITCYDAVNSRYPKIERNYNPLDYYNDVYPVIMKFDKLLNLQKFNLIQLNVWRKDFNNAKRLFE